MRARLAQEKQREAEEMVKRTGVGAGKSNLNSGY
jgi:hypothetical protein